MLAPGSLARLIDVRKRSPILRMTPIDRKEPSPKSVKYLRKALLFGCLQILLPGSLADLVVKEKDIGNLQLDQVQAQAELVEDTTLPLECRRQVKILSI